MYQEVLKHLEAVTERGDYSSALCPFHDDAKASLLIYPDGYFCMACGARGSLTKLLKKVRGYVPETAPTYQTRSILDLPEDKYELEQLIDSANSMLESYRQPLAWYLKQRRVDGRITAQNLGYYAGWYSIPIYDLTCGFMGAVFRASPPVQQATGLRYYLPHGQKPSIYVPNWERTLETEYQVVVFGIFDALALEELGIPVCTPTHGMNSIQPHMLAGFRKRILVLPDKGEEEVGMKLVSGLGWRGQQVRVTYPDNCKDPADCLEHGQDEWLCDIIDEGMRR